MESKIGTAVCRAARTVVWEVGGCESRRQLPFMISIYLLPDCFCPFRAWIARAASPGWRSLRSLTPGYKQTRLRRVWDSLQPSSALQEGLVSLCEPGIQQITIVLRTAILDNDFASPLGNPIAKGRQFDCQRLALRFPRAGNMIPKGWEHDSQRLGTRFPRAGNMIPKGWEHDSQGPWENWEDRQAVLVVGCYCRTAT